MRVIMSSTALPPAGYCKYCSNPDVSFYVIHYGHCPKLHEIFIQREQEKTLIDEIQKVVEEATYNEFFS